MIEPPATFTCPMHPDVRRTSPGLCPECGMQLVPAGVPRRHRHAAHGTPDKHAGHTQSLFARKFWVSLLLTLPVLATSELAARLLGLEIENIPGRDLAALVLASIVFFYGGWVFLIGAARELRGRAPGMMTLIALAIVVAYVYSVVVTVIGRGEALFWELTTLITIMLLGHWIEMRAVQGAQGALRELSKLLPDTADVVRDGKATRIPLRDLRVGDRMLVRPGSAIPADGTVADGSSDVNEALVTGESRPVPKEAGSTVIAGTVNGDGALTVNVMHIGEQTFLAGIMRLVADAQASKSRLQLLADRAAFALTVIAVAAGLVTLVAWLAVRAGPGVAIEHVVAVLVIACPHALGLAVPLVASISTTLGARNGVLIRERRALEAARTIDTVLLDKTGTLTKGEFGVEQVWAFADATEGDVLRVAASVDARSEHVIAKAIVREAERRGLPPLEVSDAAALPGKGMRGTIAGESVTVGGLSVFDGEVPENIASTIAPKAQEGKSIVFVRRGDAVIGALALGDVIRPESKLAVQALKTLGLRLGMVTGDSREVADWVARELGIEQSFARVPPAGKAETVRRLQHEGRRVAFVGDGINDAPALTQADVGIAIGAGTNVAIESAGILLVRNDPRDIVKIIRLSRATYAKMIQNLFWATGYNVVALPLAAGVLAPRGIVLEPAVAALLMSLSTVIVALNALLLRRTLSA